MNKIVVFFVIIASLIVSTIWWFSSDSEVKDLTAKPVDTVAPVVDTTTNDKHYISTDQLSKQLDDYFDVSTTSELKQISQTTPAKISPWEAKVAALKKLLENIESNQDTTAIDNKIIEFLEDESIPRPDKIYALWNLASQFQLGTDKGIYLLDYLETLRPIELTKEFIDTFSSGIANPGKIRLLRLLHSSLLIANLAKQTPEQLQFIVEQSEAIQKFFTTQVASIEDKEVFREALMLYPSVVPAEEAASVIREISSTHSDKISEQDIMALSLQVAFASDETQAKFLPPLLDSLQQPQNDSPKLAEQDFFNEQLYSILKDENAITFVSDKVRPQLVDYLNKQEPKLSFEDASVPFEVISNYNNWVNAYATVVSKTDSERAEFIANAIAVSDDPIRQSVLIVLAKPEELNNLVTNQHITEVEKSLRKSLDTLYLSQEQKNLLETALQEISSATLSVP